MSNSVIAFLVSVSAATWVFNKFYKSTGANTQKSMGGAVVVFVLVFLFVVAVLSKIN